ncbi:hypothetical protein EVAR_29537_1 [Eumeta japonica]|uniref:Uncharacterized protein n=1 Tax=Eumeta variegata TaxID=151549 RepID=A0A4C1WIH1_EUMVA|nr:hypothetical protein EVAR_29537_1 [Eumeta japonica]
MQIRVTADADKPPRVPKTEKCKVLRAGRGPTRRGGPPSGPRLRRRRAARATPGLAHLPVEMSARGGPRPAVRTFAPSLLYDTILRSHYCGSRTRERNAAAVDERFYFLNVARRRDREKVGRSSARRRP